MVTVLI